LPLLLKSIFAIIFIISGFAASVFSGTPAPQIYDSIVTSGILAYVPDAPPLEKIPPKLLLDENPMPADERFFYANTPAARMHSRDQGTLFLKKAVHYITGIPESKIPQEIKYLPFVLKSRGFRIYKLQKLESKAAQVLLANGIPLLVEMCSVEGRGNAENKNTVTVGETTYSISRADKPKPVTSQEYYDVIKGYAPIETGVLYGLRKGEEKESAVFYLYDDYAFTAFVKDLLPIQFREMFLIAHQSQTTAQGQLCRINRAFIIVPAVQDEEKMRKSLVAMMDKVPLTYALPEIESLAEEPVE
jgi:hypothetical protein